MSTLEPNLFSREQAERVLSVNLSPEELEALTIAVTDPAGVALEVSPLMERALDRVPDARRLLHSQFMLRHLRAPAEEFTRRRHEIRTMLPPGFCPPMAIDPFDTMLEFCETLARTHTEFLSKNGFGYNFNKHRVTLPPTGGTPPTLYSELVIALRDEVVQQEGREPRPAKLRKLLAPHLVGIFGEDLASTDAKGKLAETLYNVTLKASGGGRRK